MYILFEGIDGCGKSTQIELLKNKYFNLIVTKEPGGTELGQNLREILLNSNIKSKKAELFLFLADRAEHFKELIEPNLEKLIISDRGFISGIAYAMEAGFELDFLLKLNSFALSNVLPQKILFFKIDKETLINRIGQRGAMDKIESRGFEYLMNIQDNMQKVIDKLDIESLIIDASRDIESINKDIIEFIGDIDDSIA